MMHYEELRVPFPGAEARHIALEYLRRQEKHIRSTALTNYTPLDWWECDLFEVTKARYFREYEVKLSRSDFFADAKKEQTKGGSYDLETRQWKIPPPENKHDLLKKADKRGPSQFWFITPLKLITLEELPPWAGLIEFCTHADYPQGMIRFDEIVAAPRLHKHKVDEKLIHSALYNCYYRYHELLGPKLHEYENRRTERTRLAAEELPADQRGVGDAGPGSGDGDRPNPASTPSNIGSGPA